MCHGRASNIRPILYAYLAEYQQIIWYNNMVKRSWYLLHTKHSFFGTHLLPASFPITSYKVRINLIKEKDGRNPGTRLDIGKAMQGLLDCDMMFNSFIRHWHFVGAANTSVPTELAQSRALAGLCLIPECASIKFELGTGEDSSIGYTMGSPLPHSFQVMSMEM